MPEPTNDRPAPDPDDARAQAARRRRRAEIFGEVLPETTADEREDAPTGSGEDRNEAWLKAQVPPHHG